MTRFTFAVCLSCGVQSPPILLDNNQAEIANSLAAMNWRYHNLAATCPVCSRKENITQNGKAAHPQ